MSDLPDRRRGTAAQIPTLTDVVVEGRPPDEPAPPLSVPLRAARPGAGRPAPPQAGVDDTPPAAPDTGSPDPANPNSGRPGPDPDAALLDAVAERLRTRLARQLSDAVDAALMLHGPQIAETVQRQIEPWLRTEIAAELRRQARARTQAAPPRVGD